MIGFFIISCNDHLSSKQKKICLFCKFIKNKRRQSEHFLTFKPEPLIYTLIPLLFANLAVKPALLKFLPIKVNPPNFELNPD